jgi:PASTA domain
MDGQQHEQSQQRSVGAPKDLSFNFAAIFTTLLANPEVRTWLHHLMDTALDNIGKRGPEGTVIWGTKHGQIGAAPDVSVPDVMGKTKNQATSTLESAGVNGTFTGPDAGHVSAQDPQAGATLKYGENVNVTLS